MKRLLVVLLGALLMALVVVTTAVLLLARSEAGTRFLAAQAERFLPVRLTDVSGTLWEAVAVGRVELSLEEDQVVIEGLEVALNLVPLLFDNRLILHNVQAVSVTVRDVGVSPDTDEPVELVLPFMPVELEVAELRVERLDVYDSFPLAVTASAAWLRRGVIVRALAVTSEVINADLTGELGTGRNPRLNARGNWSLPDGDWSGSATLSGRVDALDIQHTLRGMVSGEAEGRADLSDLLTPRVAVDAVVNDLTFGDTVIGGITGRIEGTLENLQANASAQVSAPGFDPFPLEVSAYGPVTGPLTLANIDGSALAGRVLAQGSLDWSGDVALSLGGTFQGISLATLRPELEGDMNGAFELHYAGELLRASLRELSGTLNGRQVAGELEVTQLEDGWVVDPLRLEAGENLLAGSLSVRGPIIDLVADVDAGTLDALALPVAGDVAGKVRLFGRWPDLNGRVSLTSSRLASRLEELDAVLEGSSLQAELNDGVLAATLTAERASREDVVLSGTRLRAQGSLEDLAWQFAWAEGEGTGTLKRRTDTLELGLRTARMTLLEQAWKLDGATRLVAGPGGVELAAACVSGGGSEICVDTFSYAAGRIATRGALKRAPVGLLQPWLPVQFADSGYLEGYWDVAGAPDDWQGELRLAARKLAYVVDPEQPPIDLPDLEAQGAVSGDVLTLTAQASAEDFSVSGEGRLTSLTPDGTLSGSISAEVADLAPLKVFDQRIESLSGRLEGNLAISGTLSAPRAEGQFRATGGELRLNDPDVALTGVELGVRLADTGTFEVDGRALQQDNPVTLKGRGSGLFSDALAFEASLAGRNLRAEHPDWEVLLSPDLTMTFADGKGRIRGRVEVPRAEVRLKTLPTSVPSPSEDVVVVGRETNGVTRSNPIRVDVELVLGDDVSLKALGITAELTGSLRARLDARGRASLRGTLDIAGGVLSTQGQTLTIESGSVVYNGPVTRPYIDLRAVRVIEDTMPPVKVGLHIRGDADNLTSSVYSEPAMSETRALSYMVLGRDIDQQTSDSDSGQLVAAAINLGLSRSKGIASELKRRTGLDELSAMAEAQNSFAIVAGKRVTKDLYVRYTYNTLSAVGAFLVRYDLGQRWHLEAESGEASAMDLMYSVEK